MSEELNAENLKNCIQQVMRTGSLVKFVIAISEYCGDRVSDKEIELLHVLADAPGMDRALSMVENVEFVRRRLYKDILESEEYARGLREELGVYVC